MEEYERVALPKDRLQEAMNLADVKVSQLAKDTGIHRATIYRYLNGEVVPRSDAAHKLARRLGVSEFYLWGFDVPRVRVETQKKNDDLLKVVAQLRTDAEFFDVVQLLASLPTEQYASVKNIILSLSGK